MEPIIYELPKCVDGIPLDESNIKLDTFPCPKLIKYGFNNVKENMNLINVISDPYYKDGLQFDFDRTDAKSIGQEGKKKFGVKNFDQTFAEFWELFNLFGLLNQKQTILTNKLKETEELVDAYQKISKSKHKISVTDKSSKEKVDTIIQKYSEKDIDENASFQFIFNDLPKLMSIQEKGSNMILQVFNVQTQVMAQLICYLNCLYDYAYLVKPAITSDLFDSKYLVLIGLRKAIKVSTPKIPNDKYVHSIMNKNIPEELDTVVRCMNSELFPSQISLYLKLKLYVDTKIYDGETNKEMLNAQNENIKKWLETFTDISKIQNLMSHASEQSKNKCNKYIEWENKL